MRIILLLWFAITGVAHAEVYKCASPTKQIIYQPTPCSIGTENKNIVPIEKLSPRQLEDAQNRLKATEAERQALDQAEQARQDAAAAQWQAEAPQREAAAARQAAQAAQQEAAAARQQVESMNNSYPYYTPYPNYRDYHGGYHHRDRYPQYPTVNPYFSPKPLYPNSPQQFIVPNPNYKLYPSPYTAPYAPVPMVPHR